MATGPLSQEELPTLDDFLSRHGLEKKHLEEKISAQMILEMAQLLDDWKMTGYYLGFEEQKLNDIKVDESCEEHRRVALLKAWEQLKGEGATYLKLAEAFYHRERIRLVEKLCRMRLTEITRMDIGNCTKADDPSSKDYVQQRLKSLEESIANLNKKFRRELVETKVTVEDLFDALTFLPIALRREYQESVKREMLQVETFESTDRILHLIVNPLTTFLDYKLLQHLISKFGSSQLKQDMADYVDDVEKFKHETTVVELMDHWEGIEDKSINFSELQVHFGVDPTMCTLKELDDYRRKFCARYKLSEFVMVLIHLKPTGSFIAVWRIPTVLIGELMGLINKMDRAFFDEEKIISISLAGEWIHPLSSHQDPSPEVTSTAIDILAMKSIKHSKDDSGSSDVGGSAAVRKQSKASPSHKESERIQDQGDEEEEDIGMFRAHKTLLEKSINDLANMDPEKVTTQLKRQGLFDDNDCEVIHRGVHVTTFDKNIKIIEELQRRGPTAFDTLFKILNSINEASAEMLLPIRHRILWFTSSPRYAATVTYALEKYFDHDAMLRQNKHGSYLLRKGRIFKRSIPTKILNSDEDIELVQLAQDVELYLAFPISERGNAPQKALKDAFEELGSKVTVAVLSGVCVGVRGDGARGEELEVKGGEVVLATEAISLDGRKRELPLSSALMEAKTHLSQLPEENKEWLGEAKVKLKELEQGSGIPIREHPRLVPHFDTIRQDIQAVPTDQPRFPRALASDSDTFLFYDLCAKHLGVERPWFSCKGAIGHAMLNNVDPAQDPGSVCALMSTFFALEACKTIVDKLRQSSQIINSRSK